MSGALKLILEMGKEEPEETVECPKCGCMCEEDDMYCHECGTKLPAPEKAMKGARMDAMKKMMSEEKD